MKSSSRIVLTALLATLVFPAHAYTFKYACKVNGKLFPLKVDDERQILEWQGVTYKISLTDCGKLGWRAESRSASFDFCTATQGYADFEQNGIKVICDLKRPSR